MSESIQGNFAADGDSTEFVAKQFTVLLGTDTNEDFGGGTVEVKYKQIDQLDWTTDETTYIATAAFTSIEFVSGMQCKLTLTGATSPNLDYSIVYRD